MNRFLPGHMIMPLRSPDDPAAAAAAAAVTPPVAVEPPAVVPPADPGSVLFPNDAPKADPDPNAGKEPGAEPERVEWKEYENDAAKTDEENAAAKAEHDKTKPAAADPLDAVPADGKYTLTMPEGVTVDQALLDALSPKFAAKGMTTREAQELADEFINVEKGRREAANKNWAETVAKWVDDAKTDPDMGGAKWDATATMAKKAIDAIGTPALKEYLQATGGGNHPELIRIFAKVGPMISEDNPANGGAGGAGSPVEPAHRLYANDAPKG
ncbi:hypothetical protein AX761_21760 [Rhizobium sp. 58]|nr:hypothetical protein AX761_21760 [Rhizobium sp. 58]